LNSAQQTPAAIEPDYDYWARISGWTAEEAAWLLLGHDPDSPPEQDTTTWAYRRTVRYLERAYDMAELSNPERPRDVIDWAKTNTLTVPVELEERVLRGEKAPNWRARYRSMKKQRNNLRVEREQIAAELERIRSDQLDARERTTMQKLLLGMAKSKFNFRPGAARSDTVRLIKEALGETYKLSDDTILRKLQEAAETLDG
jgi:hypothetical protein